MEPDQASEERLCLDPATEKRVRARVNRLAGQVAGVGRMLEDGRRCEEILVQIASFKQAANGLAAELLQAHIQQCVHRSRKAGEDHTVVERIQGAVKSVLKHT